MKKFLLSLLGLFLIGISILIFLSIGFDKHIEPTVPKIIVFSVILIGGIAIGSYFLVISSKEGR